MRTLYLRNVPDDVADRLQELAGREGMSVSAFAVRELTYASGRARNAQVLDALPDFGVSSAATAAVVRESRDRR